VVTPRSDTASMRQDSLDLNATARTSCMSQNCPTVFSRMIYHPPQGHKNFAHQGSAGGRRVACAVDQISSAQDAGMKLPDALNEVSSFDGCKTKIYRLGKN